MRVPQLLDAKRQWALRVFTSTAAKCHQQRAHISTPCSIAIRQSETGHSSSLPVCHRAAALQPSGQSGISQASAPSSGDALSSFSDSQELKSDTSASEPTSGLSEQGKPAATLCGSVAHVDIKRDQQLFIRVSAPHTFSWIFKLI